jgi:ABC-type glycerol-3-phosphate transport system substrate-binding protein
MQWKSTALCYVFLIGAAALLSGCISRRPVEPAEFTGVRLQIACPDEASAAYVRTAGVGWATRHETKPENLVVSTYDPQQGPPDGVDVWILPAAQLGRWKQADKLERVPPQLVNDETYGWSGLLPVYRDRLLVRELDTEGRGVPCALPLLGEMPVLCWRTDLLREAPATWQEVEKLADEWEAKKAGWFRTVHLLPPWPRSDEDLEHEFYSVAAPLAVPQVAGDKILTNDDLAFHCDLETGRPRLADEPFVEALSLLRKFRRRQPQGATDDPNQAFLNGKAALCVTDLSAVAAFQAEPTLRDRFAVAPVPGSDHYWKTIRDKEKPERRERQNTDRGNRMPYLGARTLLAVVPKSSSNKEAAWSLLADLSGREVTAQAVFVPHRTPPYRGGGVLRVEQLDASVRWEDFDLGATVHALNPADKGLVRWSGDRLRTPTDALRTTLDLTLKPENVANPTLRLRTPDEANLRKLLLAELRDVVAGTKDPGQALQQATEGWETIRKKDKEAWLAEQRTSVGLRPE